MKNAVGILAALIVTVVAACSPAAGRDFWAPYDEDGFIPGTVVEVQPVYRCSPVPVVKAYDGMHFHRYIPAVHLGYAYRPFYRYSAYRVVPPTFACEGFYHRYDDPRRGWRW
jgi:hypothetical protein